MFVQLDSVKKNDPKGYMDLIKSMRDGNFDREVSDDTSGISPKEWFSHFSNLLSKYVHSDLNIEQKEYIESHSDLFKSELDFPFTKCELIKGLKGLSTKSLLVTTALRWLT